MPSQYCEKKFKIEQFRAELETGAGAEPEVAEPRDDEGTDSMPELESMEEG